MTFVFSAIFPALLLFFYLTLPTSLQNSLLLPSSPTSSKPRRQLEPARNLSLENSSRIILHCRSLQTRHIFPSISRYRILGLIRVIQVYEFMQQSHLPGRFVRFLHDGLSRLLHESIGGCGGPEGAEEKYCKHPISTFRFYLWNAGLW